MATIDPHWVLRVLCVVIAYAALQRLFGVLVSLVASRKQIQIRVDAIGFLVIRGVTITFAQGPLKRIQVQQLSLGRSASAKKTAARVAGALSRFRPRIPLTLRDVVIELRTPPQDFSQQTDQQPPRSWLQQPNQRTGGLSRSGSPPHDSQRKLIWGSQDVDDAADPVSKKGTDVTMPVNKGRLHDAAHLVSHGMAVVAASLARLWAWLPIHLPLRLVGNAALHVLLAVLPSAPVRIKGITIIFEELWMTCATERITILLQSSHLFAQLHASITVEAVCATIKSPNDTSKAEQFPLLDVDSFTANAGLSVFWRAGGLRFNKFGSALGRTSLVVTPVLLAAFAAFEHSRRTCFSSVNRQSPGKRQRQSRPATRSLPRLIARAPHEAEFRVPLLQLRSQGFDADDRNSIYVGAEARQLEIRCTTQQRPTRQTSDSVQSFSDLSGTSRSASKSFGNAHLLQVAGSFGGFDARMGSSISKDAADAHGAKTTLFICLLQPLKGWMSRQSPQLTAQGTISVGELVGRAKPHAAWPAAESTLAWWQHNKARILKVIPPSATDGAGIAPVTRQSSSIRANSSSDSSKSVRDEGVRCAPSSVHKGSTASQATWAPDLQLHVDVNLAPTSRAELLSEQGNPIARLCSSGASFVVATQGSTGSATGSQSEGSTPSSSFVTPPRQRRISGIFSANATPHSMRESREATKTPLSAVSGWLRRNTAGLDNAASLLLPLNGHERPRPSQMPLVSRTTVRANLGRLHVETLCSSLQKHRHNHAAPSLDAIRGAGSEEASSQKRSSEPCSPRVASCPTAEQIDAATDSHCNMSTSSQSGSKDLQELVIVKGALLSLLPKPSSESPVADFEGKAVLSGIRCSIDAHVISELSELVATMMPPSDLLAAARTALPPANKASTPSAGYSRQQRQPKARISLVSISLEDWRIVYSAVSPRVPIESAVRPASDSDHAMSDSNMQVAFCNTLAIRSVTADMLPQDKSASLAVSDLSVSYQVGTAGFRHMDTDPQSVDEGCSPVLDTPLPSPFAGSARITSPVLHVLPKHDAGNADSRVTRILLLSTLTVGLPSADSVPASRAMHVDARGVNMHFDPDAVFAAIDVAAELRAIADAFSQLAARRAARAVAAVDDVAAVVKHPTATIDAALAEASDADGSCATASKSQRMHASLMAEQTTFTADDPIGSGRRLAARLQRLQWAPKGKVAIAVRDLAVALPIADSVHFTFKVEHVGHMLGTLQAESSAISLELNNEAVARLYALQLQLEPLCLAEGRPNSQSVAPKGAVHMPSQRSLKADIRLSQQSASVPSRPSGPKDILLASSPDFRPGKVSNAFPARGTAVASPSAVPHSPGSQHSQQQADLPSDMLPDHIKSAAVAFGATMDGVRVLLPHGLEVGTAIRHTELWAKAFTQELAAHIARQLPARGRSQIGLREAPSRPTLELRLRVTDAAFVMLHHPLEAWLAMHGRSLRAAIAEQRMWERVLETLPAAGSNDYSARWRASVHQTADNYKAACAQVNARDGNLMRVSVEGITASIVLCAGGKEGNAAARSLVDAVDAPSVGVPLSGLCRIHLSATLSGAGVRFCGNTQPMVGVDNMTIRGPLAIARQSTAPATVELRAFPVGRRRMVTIQVTVKGSRAPPKLYSDISVAASGVNGGYSMGLLPTLGLVAVAGKRLSLADPDKGRPKPRKLPWWDEMRYQWRGKLHVAFKDVDFALGTSVDPQMSITARRLQVTTPRLDVKMTTGRASIVIDGMEAVAHAAPHPAHAPSSLLALPLLRLPSLLTRVSFAWRLASGRDFSDHYLFPVPVPVEEGARQPPVDIVAAMLTESFDVKMDYLLGPSEGSVEEQQDDPVFFAGDHQMRFVQELIATLKAPPQHLKQAKKCGTYFARKPKGTMNPDVIKLWQGFDINLHVASMRVVHWTAVADDPSCGITLTIEDVCYDHRMLRCQNVSSDAKRLLPKSHSGVTTETVAVDVRGSNLFIRADGDCGFPQASQSFSHTSTSSRGLPGDDRGENTDAIAFIAAFTVHQGSSEMSRGGTPGDRTIQTTMQDCRFAFDLASRNAVWGVVEHMAAGVAPFKKPPFKKPSAHNMDDNLPSGPERPPDGPSALNEANVVSDVANEARTHAHDASERIPTSPSHQRQHHSDQQPNSPDSAQHEYDTGGDLMRILMQQDRAEVAASGGVAGAAQHLTQHWLPGDVPDDASDVVLHAASDDEEHDKQLGSPGEVHDTSHPTIHFRIRVNLLQVAAVAASGTRFLLAAEAAHVLGIDMPDRHRVVTLDVREVQAYMSRPSKGCTPWLDCSKGGLCPPSDALRMVFAPFSLHLRHAKQQGADGQDLRIKAPEISASLSSQEFLGFVDIVRHVMMPPGPKVAKLNGELALLGEAEDDTVAVGREAFALLYQEVAALSAEAHVLRQGLRTSWQSVSSSSSKRLTSSSRSLKHSASGSSRFNTDLRMLCLADDADIADDVGGLPEALREHIASLSTETSIGVRNSMAGRRLLLRWVLEQAAGAAQALVSIQNTLTEDKAAARKRMPNNDAANVGVEVDAIKWALLQERRAFFAASLSGLKLAMTRNDDNSGFSKFIIKTIEIEEPRGSLSRTASGAGSTSATLERRAIVSAWNPDQSWNEDPAVRATAVMGVPTQNKIIYDNLDLLVHPMTVSFTDRQLNQLWQYFIPKSEYDELKAAARPKEELWIKSMIARSLKRGKGSGTSQPSAGVTLNEEVLDSLPESNMAVVAGFVPPGASPFGDGQGLGQSAAADARSQHSGASLSQLANRPKWLNPKSWVRKGGAADVSFSNVSTPALSSAVLAHPAVTSTLAASHTTSAAIATGRVDSRLHARTTAEDGSKGRRRAAAPPQVALFRHVRFNRVHVAITYKGTFFGLNDAKMVLDNRQYAALEGSWGDLFTKLKWDIIKSVVKSMTGLQGSKVKELLPSHLRAATSRTERRALKRSVKAWLSGHAPNASASASVNYSSINDATMQELRKTQLLLGHRHVQRLAASHMASLQAATATSTTEQPSMSDVSGLSITSVPS